MTLSYADAFHVPEGGPYLLAHSVGCLPKAVPQALQDGYLAAWAEGGGDAWPDWLGQIDRFRSAVASLLGGLPEHWCPQAGVSSAIARIVGGLEPEPGRNCILVSEHAFPSVVYALQGLSRVGLRVEIVPGDPRQLSSWFRLRDRDIAAMVLMHVHSNNGLVSPVAELADLARRNGVFTIVDIAQSGGILPIDVTAWGADAVVGSSVKWLAGGPGACFAWIAPDAVGRLFPIERGWFSHADPFAMDVRDFRFAPDARRLWGGTPVIAPFVMATAAIEVIAAIGIAAARAHNLHLATRLLEALDGALGDPDSLRHSGGTLCLSLGSEAEAALKAAGARFDRRGDRLRLSFGIWNDVADADCVAEALRSALLQGRLSA